MKLVSFRLLALIAFISIGTAASAFNRDKAIQADTAKFVSPYAEENENCFKCHGQEKYQYSNETLGRQVKALMCSQRIINRDEFYDSNHKNFTCTDCHSYEYSTFPHPGNLRMEQKMMCLDCHGGDENYAKFGFEKIDEEYQKSVHFKLEEEGFTCWKCHNPHSYKISVRNSENIKETIRYDNAICLNCHSNFDRFQLLTDREEINIVQKHDWLPNQTSHFSSVRCIECHTQSTDSILVAHQIRPKTEAVKLCNECHSKNSMLMASLYKYQSKERRQDGFFNGVILNESYVIGANRNQYLNLLSLLIFGIAIVVIGIHIYFRTTIKK